MQGPTHCHWPFITSAVYWANLVQLTKGFRSVISDWLKRYINLSLCTRTRTQCKNKYRLCKEAGGQKCMFRAHIVHLLLISGGSKVSSFNSTLALKTWEILLRLLVSFKISVNTPSSWLLTNWICVSLFA